MNKCVFSAAQIVMCVFAVSPVFASADAQGSQSIGTEGITQLDTRFQEFSTRFYANWVRIDKPTKLKSIDALRRSVDEHKTKDLARAVAAIVANIDVVEKNIDTTTAVVIIEILLQANDWKTATRLYNKLKEDGDKTLVSGASLSLADYHFARDQWEKTVRVTEVIGAELALEDFHRTLLMRGVALQHLRKHRAALTQYAKIPKTSRYYAQARLNMAVANIRQDWWTDAHRIMETLVRDGLPSQNPALTDRLYTILGYSLLRQQYFRHARDAFRNVSLAGPYTNKALLGIALSAAYQNDYIGALNAVRVLKSKDTYELPVDEANLLMPYVYEKLEQRTTAMAGYSQAIKYYEDRIANIEKAMPTNAATLSEQLPQGGPGAITINREVLNLQEKLPQAFFDSFKLLASYRPHVERLGDAGLKQNYSVLTGEYTNALQKAVQHALTEKIAYLNHYMSQSRFGLATINDSGPAPQ